MLHIEHPFFIRKIKESAYMIYWWDHGPFDVVRLSDLVMPDDDRFVFCVLLRVVRPLDKCE